jgi:drug/metabolite transporter (DMT)-like permease
MEKGYFFTIAAGLLFGTIVFGGKILSGFGLSAYELAILPYIVPILILLPVVLLNKKYRLKSSQLPLWLLYGLVCAITAFSQFSAFILGVPVSIVVLLLYTQPLWCILMITLFMKEKITLKEIIASVIVILGVVILVNPFGAKLNNVPGLLVALVGGIGLAAWLVIGSYASKKKIHPITTKFSECLFQIPFLVILWPIANVIFNNPSITSFSFHYGFNTIIAIIIFGLFSQTLAHLLYFKGVQTVPTMHASIISLLEPIVAVILSAIFLHEAITVYVIVGGILILFANYLVIRK